MKSSVVVQTVDFRIGRMSGAAEGQCVNRRSQRKLVGLAIRTVPVETRAEMRDAETRQTNLGGLKLASALPGRVTAKPMLRHWRELTVGFERVRAGVWRLALQALTRQATCAVESRPSGLKSTARVSGLPEREVSTIGVEAVIAPF